jgi:DNA-directed RNA polymerase specialized sigma24 family protein
MAAPPSDPTVADRASDTSLPANDAAPSSGRAVSAVAEEAPPPSGVTESRVIAALRRFLASREKDEGDDFIKGVIIRKLGKDIEPALLDDLVHLAHVEALEAQSPPLTVYGVRGWMFRVTRRAIAHYFKARKDDDENLEPGAEVSDWTDRHAPQTDWGARELLITNWLGKQIGDDPVRVKTFRLMVEHEVHGRTLGELAAENRTTEGALSSRFYKLRQELIPRLALMDQEKPRRAIFVLLFLFACGVIAAVLYLLLLGPTPIAPTATPVLRPAPTTTASVVEPTFDNALPTQPSASPDVDDGKKPPPLKP